MSDLYTDDDAALAARHANPWVRFMASDGNYSTTTRTPLEIAVDVLEAVAPAIAARALRSAAEWIVESMTCSPDGFPDTHCDAIREAAGELRWRADEIERT